MFEVPNFRIVVCWFVTLRNDDTTYATCHCLLRMAVLSGFSVMKFLSIIMREGVYEVFLDLL